VSEIACRLLEAMAILQGASAVPISAANAGPARISARRATPENRESVPARRVALKMGWRRRCDSVAAPLGDAPSPRLAGSPFSTQQMTSYFRDRTLGRKRLRPGLNLRLRHRIFVLNYALPSPCQRAGDLIFYAEA